MWARSIYIYLEIYYFIIVPICIHFILNEIYLIQL